MLNKFCLVSGLWFTASQFCPSHTFQHIPMTWLNFIRNVSTWWRRQITQSWGNLQIYWCRLGHLAEVRVCLVWIWGLSEPDALCESGTVPCWDSKHKKNWGRHAVRRASLTLPTQEILLLILKAGVGLRTITPHPSCGACTWDWCHDTGTRDTHKHSSCAHIALVWLFDNQTQSSGQYYLLFAFS